MLKPKRKVLRGVPIIIGLLGAELLLLMVSSFFVSSAAAASTQLAASGRGSVVIADFNVPVDPGSAAFMSRVVATAENQNAAAIVIEMNTPGGSLGDMLSIISSITAANQSTAFQHTLSLCRMV